MGLRFYHRFQLAPGFTLNLGRGGASVSAGVRGAHVTVGRHGTRESVGLPGTGLSYIASQVGRRRPKAHHYVADIVGLILIYPVVRPLLFGGSGRRRSSARVN